MKASLALLTSFLTISTGFVINKPLVAAPKTILQAGPGSLEDLLSSPETWEPIKEEMNQVPVFSCANDQGQPLQYNVGGGPVAFFFCDIDAAKAELKKAEDETKLTNLNILPFPLGECFEMGAKNMAAIIPSAAALEAAGAPAGINPIGQQVPLFGCMAMVSEREDGKAITPLFVSKVDAEDALKMASAGAGDAASELEITVVPLAAAVQQMTGGGKSYVFEAPTSSLDYLRSSMS